jgi:hypothetical protein
MTDTATVLWDEYCAATYAAGHPAPPTQEEPRDLIDFCSSLSDLRVEITHLERILDDAAECGAARRPTLRTHRDDLRYMQVALAVLVQEAEAA